MASATDVSPLGLPLYLEVFFSTNVSLIQLIKTVKRSAYAVN